MVDFYAHESCGQCTPCREGSAWTEKILTAHRRGPGHRRGSGHTHGGHQADGGDHHLRALRFGGRAGPVVHQEIPGGVPGSDPDRGKGGGGIMADQQSSEDRHPDHRRPGSHGSHGNHDPPGRRVDGDQDSPLLLSPGPFLPCHVPALPGGGGGLAEAGAVLQDRGGRRPGGPHQQRAGPEAADGGPGVLPGEPPAGLPHLRPVRRVPAPGLRLRRRGGSTAGAGSRSGSWAGTTSAATSSSTATGA